MKPIFILVCIIVFIQSCLTTKKVIKTNEDILQYCNFVEMKSSFEMRIIDYMPGFNCGTRAFASNCIGVLLNNDTIRVLSLCNTDSTLKVNDLVIIMPMKRPTYHVSIAQFRIYKENHFNISEIQRKKLKTTYGNIKRK